MIRTVIFDMGGVIITSDHDQAVSRFSQLGVPNADKCLNRYRQAGIFGDFEWGKIDTETFRRELSLMAGRDLTVDECNWAWQGYACDVPQRNLDLLTSLRRRGFRVLLLSNTNPCMMEFVNGPRFDGKGHPLTDYLDAEYLSYELRLMKPDPAFFLRVLELEYLRPEEALFVDDSSANVEAAARLGIHTFCPKNGEDWTREIEDYLCKG